LIDSSVFIAAERGRLSLTGHLTGREQEPVVLSALTASELLHGVHRAASPERRVQRERFVKQLAAIESGASYPAVTDRQVKEQLVPLPQESEQIEIALILEACDGKIRMLQRKHMALIDLFRTLLHQLMTAQIRVYEIDLPEVNGLTCGGRDI